jgi:D-glycero-D-manno-heptose 1,7-bisphosphate phosphatase
MLILFDLDGTLITSYMDLPDREYHTWEPLPGRRERLAELLAAGHQLGIATNQAGVAFGHVSEDEVHARLREVLRALDLPADTPVQACFGHPNARLTRYRRAEQTRCRKPDGHMLREIMRAYPAAAAEGVIYVGDRPDDEGAARDAGVHFAPAEPFFLDPAPFLQAASGDRSAASRSQPAAGSSTDRP